MIPGTPAIPYEEHGDDNARAAWLLSLIDASPDRLAFIPVPMPDSEADLDDAEERMIRAFDIAKQERPDLAVKLLSSVFAGVHAGDTALVVALHEHRWIGGGCIHGCGETRS